MLKAAILGAGFIAGFHAEGYSRLPDVRLCGICDRETARAAALAEGSLRTSSGRMISSRSCLCARRSRIRRPVVPALPSIKTLVITIPFVCAVSFCFFPACSSGRKETET